MKAEFAPLHKVPRLWRAWHSAWHTVDAHSVTVSHSCWRAVSWVELLEGMVGSESLGKDWAVWSVAINVTHWARWKVTARASEQCAHRTCFRTSSPTSPLLPVASDPGAGPREDTGVYETQGRFVCIRLMALLWACSGVTETVFLKSLTFLCALHLVQE